jgi:hypothetical protein
MQDIYARNILIITVGLLILLSVLFALLRSG